MEQTFPAPPNVDNSPLYIMSVADVLETRISTRSRKRQKSQNYLKPDWCRQNENDIPIKDDTELKGK